MQRFHENQPGTRDLYAESIALWKLCGGQQSKSFHLGSISILPSGSFLPLAHFYPVLPYYYYYYC